MQNNVKKEMVLGVLFISAIIFLIVVTITISRSNIFSKPVFIKVEFEQISGLKKGDGVRVLGMDAGTVYRLRLLPDNKVKAVLKLDQEIEIREDYRVTVQESSILGGNYIGINPGTPGQPRVNLKNPLKGEVVSAGLDAVGEFIRENKEDVKKFLAEGIKLITDAASGKGTVGKLIKEEDLYNNFKSISENLKEVSESVKRDSLQIEKGEGNLGKLIYDDKLYIKVDESLDSIKKTLKQIESNKGFLGKIIYDQKFSDQVSQAGDSLIQIFEPVIKTKVYAAVGGKYYPETSVSIADIFIRIEPREQKYFIIGGSLFFLDTGSKIDYKDKNRGRSATYLKANLQIAYRFGEDNNTTFRTGLLEGKFGVAFDFEKPLSNSAISKIAFTYEIRDAYGSVEDQRIDEKLPFALNRAYATIKFGTHFKVYAGSSRIFSGTPEFMCGVLFEYLDDDIKNFVGLLTLKR